MRLQLWWYVYAKDIQMEQKPGTQTSNKEDNRGPKGPKKDPADTGNRGRKPRALWALSPKTKQRTTPTSTAEGS